MNNKLTRRFQVAEPKSEKTYKIVIHSDEYEHYIDTTKESYLKDDLFFVIEISRIKKGYFNAVAYFEGELFTSCSRCRDEAKVNFDVKFRRTYKYTEYEINNNEDEDLIYYNTVYIDTFDFFMDEILLINPSYILCKDSCKGVCITCGENLNKNSCNHS